MTWWQAVILGVVEGITEYLPVSSTGHLLLVQNGLGLADGHVSNAYAICIQSGAIAAVLGVFSHRVKQMGMGAMARDADGARLLANVVVAFLPAAVFGLLLDDLIQGYLFGLAPIAFAWTVGAIAILAMPHHDRPGFTVEALLPRQAVLIGLAQCIAMWPGTSRSLVTILAGVLVGLSLPAALEFSFLLGLITLGAATAFKGVQHGPEMIATYGVGVALLGFATAWLSAWIAVKWMLAYVTRRGMGVFAWWRFGMAGVAVWMIWVGW